MIVDNFNDYHNQSLLLSNIHSFSLWKIYYCYDKNKQQKEKKLNKNLTFMANLEYKISKYKISWNMMNFCYSVSCTDITIFGWYKWWQLSSIWEDPRLIHLMSGKVEEKKDTQHLFSRGSFCPWMKYFLLHTYHELQNLSFHISFWPFGVLFLFLAL